jgi:hypothetical protein
MIQDKLNYHPKPRLAVVFAEHTALVSALYVCVDTVGVERHLAKQYNLEGHLGGPTMKLILYKKSQPPI